MSEYIKESLEKMLKRDLIPMVLSLQSRMAENNNNNNNEILEEICRFYDKLSKLQSELAVTKRVNTELTKRIVTMERQCWTNAHRSRKEFL